MLGTKLLLEAHPAGSWDELGPVMADRGHRLLHGRTGFAGPRHLQICYVNRDTFISEMRVLERDLGREGPYLRIAGGAFA